MKKALSILAAGLTFLNLSSPISANSDSTDVFAMRGLSVGVSMNEFRQFPIVNDSGNTDLQTWCSNDTDPKRKRFYLSEDDQKIGIVECKWYSKRPDIAWMSADDHWIDLGTGKGSPTFRFIDDGSGLKLFQVQFYANSEYYPGIYAALSTNYGTPKETTAPFRTKAGGEFTSKISTWRNAASFVSLISRCRHLERYCLSFNHTTLTKNYQDRKAQLDAEAASKI